MILLSILKIKEVDQKVISLIVAQLKEAFTDGAFTVYRKLTINRWAGERVDVYAKNIRQLVGLAGFERAGLERFTKLTFVTGFHNTISIEQAPNIETLTMGNLLVRARVLATGDQSQDVAAAVRSPHSGIAPAAKSGSISCVICHRRSSKGHIAKDCRKHGTHCFRSGNETKGRASAPAFSPTKM